MVGPSEGEVCGRLEGGSLPGEVLGRRTAKDCAQEGGRLREEDLGSGCCSWVASAAAAPPPLSLAAAPSSSRPPPPLPPPGPPSSSRPPAAEQPAAPRPRSLCLGPPGAQGPAQAGHAGTEEAERTGCDGETGEEPAKRHRHHHHQPPPPPSPSLTVAHPSSPASPPISYPCAVPTLSDHLLFTGYYFGKATECAKSEISTSAVGHLSSPFYLATSIISSGKGAQWHFIPLNHTEMAGLLPVFPVLALDGYICLVMMMIK
ncbi:ran-binding protein 9-like [Symphalangus syndactylus]|uniref:ran-binding protein 9-like n=1 Tax=Symphalangus syndactylus TaxID=9590 RepID=UPI0030043131